MFKYAKAITSAVVAGSGALATALADDAITSGEWLVIAIAVLGALGITAAVPNKPERTDPNAFGR